MARIVELILTSDKVGKGTDEDPVRREIELWTKSGYRVAFMDPFTGRSWVDSKLEEKISD